MSTVFLYGEWKNGLCEVDEIQALYQMLIYFYAISIICNYPRLMLHRVCGTFHYVHVCFDAKLHAANLAFCSFSFCYFLIYCSDICTIHYQPDYYIGQPLHRTNWNIKVWSASNISMLRVRQSSPDGLTAPVFFYTTSTAFTLIMW